MVTKFEKAFLHSNFDQSLIIPQKVWYLRRLVGGFCEYQISLDVLYKMTE